MGRWPSWQRMSATAGRATSRGEELLAPGRQGRGRISRPRPAGADGRRRRASRAVRRDRRPDREPLLAVEECRAGRGAAAIHQQRRDLRRQPAGPSVMRKRPRVTPSAEASIESASAATTCRDGRLCAALVSAPATSKGTVAAPSAPAASPCSACLRGSPGRRAASTPFKVLHGIAPAGLQHRADDLDALDRVDAEVGLDPLVEPEHVARIAGPILDDGRGAASRARRG